MSRRRLFGIAGAGVTAGLLGTTGALAAAGAAHAGGPSVRHLRALTYNIHHGADSADVLDLERIAALIEDLEVDLVGLQEVDRHWGDRSDNVDQPAWLGERLGMHHVYGANLDLDPVEPGQPRRQYGTAVLSRWPITSWSNTFLPLYPGHEQRGLLRTEIAFWGTTLHFHCTHLQHNDAAERVEQAQRIVELIGSSPCRTLLVGDLNAVPDTPEITALTDVLVDSWAKVGRGDGFTIPVDEPNRRIDYILGSADLRPVRAKVVRDDASDHLPYVADYLVRV
ncbi:MAG TPA: endonuclease/exonuclease/phosphatase family protein [Actinopolymorphaceae bacterium]